VVLALCGIDHMVQPVVQHLLCLVVPLLLVTAALLAWQPARFTGAGSAGPCQHCNATRVAFFTAGECGRAISLSIVSNAIAVPASASHSRASGSYRMKALHVMCWHGEGGYNVS